MAGRPPIPIVTLSRAAATGVAEVGEPGVILGRCRYRGPNSAHEEVVSAGAVQIGIGTYIIGVTPGRACLFFFSGRRMWLLRMELPQPVPPVPWESRPMRQLWADALARACIDRLTLPAEQILVAAGVRRYHATVRGLVDGRVLDAAELGEDRSHDSFAHGVCVQWTGADLVRPYRVTMQHGLLVALVLALPSPSAAKLIEYAAFLEHRLHVIDREAAARIYAHAAQQVAVLCPAWLSQGYLTDWPSVGDLDRVFRSQHARLMRESVARSIPPEDIVGTAAASLLRELRTSDPQTWRATAGAPVAASITEPPQDETPIDDAEEGPIESSTRGGRR